jgi:hypothetical protein
MSSNMRDEIRGAAGARQTWALELTRSRRSPGLPGLRLRRILFAASQAAQMKLAEMPLLNEDLQERGLIEL